MHHLCGTLLGHLRVFVLIFSLLPAIPKFILVYVPVIIKIKLVVTVVLNLINTCTSIIGV